MAFSVASNAAHNYPFIPSFLIRQSLFTQDLAITNYVPSLSFTLHQIACTAMCLVLGALTRKLLLGRPFHLRQFSPASALRSLKDPSASERSIYLPDETRYA